MLAIKTKLGSSSNSLRQYSASRSLSIPDSMLEFDAWLNPTCECYTVYNESGDRNIIFQYNRCSDGNLALMSVPQGSNKTVCVQNGGDVIDESGLLTVVACGTPCTTNANCTAC